MAWHPAFDEGGQGSVIPFPQRDLKASLKRARLRAVFDWARRMLAAPRYDLVIDFQGLLKSALLTYATQSDVRVGFADAREGAPLFYTHRVEVPGGRTAPHIDRNLELLRAIGVEPVPDLRLYTWPLRPPGAHDVFDPGTYVLLSPTPKGQGRAWPMERYAALARHLLADRARLGIEDVVVVGLQSERGQCEPLTRVTGVTNMVGCTTITTLIEWVRDAALVVCNDSAAMHKAVALDRPLVALFGPTDVTHAGPYRRPQDVITHKQPHERIRHRDVARASEFMRRITVDEVIGACEARLLAPRPPAPPSAPH